MKVAFCGTNYGCLKAEYDSDKVTLYLENDSKVEFYNIKEKDLNKFVFESGGWYQEPIENLKLEKISLSKSGLESYLQSHPIQWTDGKFYSITREKQQQLTSKLFAASSVKQADTEYELKWNSTGEECVVWTLEELFKLAFYIDSHVTALVSYQQALEKQINACQTAEEIESIVIDYDSVK